MQGPIASMPGYVENTKNSQVFNFSSSFFCFYSGFIHCNQKESLHLQCSCTLITACVDQRYIQYCRCNNHDNCIQLIMNTKNFGSRGLFIQYILAGWFLYSWIGERIITIILFFFFCIELPSRICPTCQPYASKSRYTSDLPLMMYSTCESCIWCACLQEFKFWQAQKYFIPSTNGNKVVLCAILYREFPFFFLLTIERRTCLLYE
jgi:hypothetical protein